MAETCCILLMRRVRIVLFAVIITTDIDIQYNQYHRHCHRFFVAFEKSGKATVIFIMSVCPYGTTRFSQEGLT